MPFEPRKPASFFIALAMIVVASWLDYATGYEISLSFLYLVPLSWAAWFLNLPGALWISLIAALAHRYTDWLRGLHYSHAWIAWERTLATWVFFAFVVFSVHTFRRGRKIDREKIQQLKDLLRVCPACDRVNHVNGQWKDLNACLCENPAKPPGHKLCPDCAAVRELADYPSL